MLYIEKLKYAASNTHIGTRHNQQSVIVGSLKYVTVPLFKYLLIHTANIRAVILEVLVYQTSTAHHVLGTLSTLN